MRSTARRWRRAALGAALLAGVPAALAVPSRVGASSVAPSAPVRTDGACAGDSGVTVVVDFGTLGGGTQTRCAPEPVSTGFDALTRAGFTYAGTSRFPGLLCRIDDKPSAQQDACQNAPSPRYYWAYWTAQTPGGTWTYSDQGAGNRDPAPGSVEGWAFSDGCTREPGTSSSCTATSTTSSTASPTTAPSTTKAPTAGGQPAAVAGTAPIAPEASGANSTVPKGDDDVESMSTTEPSMEDVAGSTNGHDGKDGDVALGSTSDAPVARPAGGGSGSPTGVMAGGALVIVLGLSAIARRRSPSTSASRAE